MGKGIRWNPVLFAVSCSALALVAAFAEESARPNANGSFTVKLSKPDMYRHALSRLTFGLRPGDLGVISDTGVKRWVGRQLHPEQIPENPVLIERLRPLESLQLTIREAYLRYPSPQLIAAVARGRGDFPDDPELRELLTRLVARYLARKSRNAPEPAPGALPSSDKTPQSSDELSDLQPRLRLSDVLTGTQIKTLRRGGPEDTRQLLQSIPADKQSSLAWALPGAEKRALFGLAPVPLRREFMRSLAPQNVIATDLAEGKLLRAVYSNRQLQELAVDFWFNNFNVFLNKGADRYTVPAYERDDIRPYVFGKFHDLLLATAKSPAMLFYLDNWQSVAPDKVITLSHQGGKAKRGLNENYGRELLELHTLGVDGGYTQRDVIEVARCFTGWGISQPRKGGVFEYHDKVHDRGPKIVLGHLIPAGGDMSDGLTVIDILSQHPGTARFISLQLARKFVADEPPHSLIDRMTRTFLRTKGDLREVFRTMILSSEFFSQGAYGVKVKTPFEMVASALRATEADLTSGYALANELGKLGEPLYRKLEPTGYSVANAEWVNSGALLGRMNFALALAGNNIPGVSVDLTKLSAAARNDSLALARLILERDPSPQTTSAVEKLERDREAGGEITAANKLPQQASMPSLVAGVTLGSPEFQRR